MRCSIPTSLEPCSQLTLEGTGTPWGNEVIAYADDIAIVRRHFAQESYVESTLPNLIEPKLLYGVHQKDYYYNVRLLDKVRKSAFIYITGILHTTLTKALPAMLNWLPIVPVAKQAAKFAATRFNALYRWHIVPSGHSTILGY